MAKKSTKSNPASDERNLIDTGATDLIELEDQLSLWWEKYQKQVLLIIGGILLAFAAYHVIQYSAKAARESQAESYKNATDKLAWANDNASSALAGFAFKELADAAYEEGDYAKAAELFKKAAAASKSSIKSAALMGQAVSLLHQDKTAEAKAILQPLADDPDSGNTAEAKFRLAEIAAQNKDYAEALALIEGVMENPTQANYYWMQKGMMLQSNFPPAPEEAAK